MGKNISKNARMTLNITQTKFTQYNECSHPQSIISEMMLQKSLPYEKFAL